MNKKSDGIIQIVPLLAIALLAFIILTVSVKPKAVKTGDGGRAVLSESVSETTAPSPVGTETPEPKETPEVRETPEPSETPEAEVEIEKEVKNGSEEAKIKIRSGRNKFEFQQEGAKLSVESNFPLSVNPTTRELTVTTPAGSKVVAVLPQQAVDNMIANGDLSFSSGVRLEAQDDGSLTYHVEGTKNEKLLGVFNVAVPKTVVISAQTGQVLVVNQSAFARILDLLSI